MSKEVGRFPNQNNLFSYVFFLLLSVVFFSPILNKGFVSDDYTVLYRIIFKRQILTKDFFRPISDISLYISYLIFGLKPFFFNITNVILHASCCFLVYLICCAGEFVEAKDRKIFAYTAALLFMLYPYHNEAIVWAIGRGILLSAFFGLLSLFVIYLNISDVKKYTISYVFYFVGLCGYETILFLPIIILLLFYKRKSSKSFFLLCGGYFVVLILNLLVRLFVSGKILGVYEKDRLVGSGLHAETFIKSIGRLFLPPSTHAELLIALFLVLAISIVFISIGMLKKRGLISITYLRLSAVLFVSIIIPAMFGVSTRTFEGDRVFYLASVFLCIWIAYIVCLLKSKYRLVTTVAILLYFIFFFYTNLNSWKEGDKQVKKIIEDVVGITNKKQAIYLINIPEEYNGTPVFRRGFTEALLINNIDTSQLRLVNYLSTDRFNGLQRKIALNNKNNKLFIPPYTSIEGDHLVARRSDADSMVQRINILSGDLIYYWNGNDLLLR